MAANLPHCREDLLETSENDASDSILCCPKMACIAASVLALAKAFS